MELAQWLKVDPSDAAPLFDQIRVQIIDAVRDGTLTPGSRLPTVRELAGDLRLAVNTVARAYRELEEAGIVETRRRLGTFIARTDPTDAAMADAAAAYVDVVRQVGLGPAEARRYLEAAFESANSTSVSAPRSQSSSGTE